VTPWPKSDVIAMGNILHDWNLQKKKQLIKSAFDALNAGGALIIIEMFVDDQRRRHAGALMISLTMLIEFGDGEGFNFTIAEFREWALEAGFARVEALELDPGNTVAVAYKK